MDDKVLSGTADPHNEIVSAPKPTLSEKEKKALRDKQKKKAETKAYHDRYFAYYDDVKTKVKEDW